MNYGHAHFFWNYTQVNATEQLWWEVNNCSGNGLVLSSNKPLPEPMLPQIYFTIWSLRPQWVVLTQIHSMSPYAMLQKGIILPGFIKEQQCCWYQITITRDIIQTEMTWLINLLLYVYNNKKISKLVIADHVMKNDFHIFLWNVISHPCHNLNMLSKLGYGGISISHSSVWILHLNPGAIWPSLSPCTIINPILLTHLPIQTHCWFSKSLLKSKRDLGDSHNLSKFSLTKLIWYH